MGGQSQLILFPRGLKRKLWARRLKGLRGFMIDALVVSVVPILVVGLVFTVLAAIDDMGRDQVIIGDISVPEALEKSGLTGTVVKQRLRSAVTQVVGSANRDGLTGAQSDFKLDPRLDWGKAQLARDGLIPQGISLSPTTLTLSDVLAFLQAIDRMLGDILFTGRVRRIDIDITRTMNGWNCIEIRLNSRRLENPLTPLRQKVANLKQEEIREEDPASYCAEDHTIDQIFSNAAEAFVWETDPYLIVARAFGDRRPYFRELLEQAMKTVPNSGETRGKLENLLGLYHLRRDQFEKEELSNRDLAMKTLQRALTYDPDGLNPRLNLALLYAAQYDTSQDSRDAEIAKGYLDEVLSRRPQHGYAHALYCFILVRDMFHNGYTTSKLTKAYQHAAHATREAPKESLGHFCQGMAYAATARINPDVAMQFWQKAFQSFDHTIKLRGSFLSAEQMGARMLIEMADSPDGTRNESGIRNRFELYEEALGRLKRLGELFMRVTESALPGMQTVSRARV